ncbi:MAG: glycoside hydrolase family 9 protein [Pricia sp.]
MKKFYYAFFITFLCCSWASAQVIYSDQFEGTLTTDSNDAYDISLENGNLVIDGNGTAGAFNAFEYRAHTEGDSVTFDMAASPQIFIRAKANGPGVLRIDAKDAAGFVTNLSAKTASLTEDYAIYSLDFSDSFNDGGFGGSPCTAATAPCPVNPSEIASLVFFVDDATGGYAGTIEIDWISVGEPLEEDEEPEADLLYSDEFEDILTTESNSAYDVSLEDGNLRIEGNGTAGAYNAFEYGAHAAGEAITFDMSSSPQIFIRARADGPGILRVDAKDASGYVTNVSANYASLTEGFAIYTLDFTGDFNDGGFGGSPCTPEDAPCPVNPAEIASLVFFVDDATGGYAGTIDIDWISVGEPLEVEQTVLLYSDQFENSLTTSSNEAYAVSLVDGNLNIVGNGTAGPYNALQYCLHDMGELNIYDLSAAPILYIKAKGTDSPSLRIDILDEDGFVTNLQANAAILNEDYGIYTLDFEGDFLDGGFGGTPCEAADAPCSVDATKASHLLLYVNDAAGGYDGVIDIDWLSFGEPLEDIEALPAGKNIRYNQVGYHLNREKLINLTSETDFDPLPYTVVDANGETVASGTTSATQLWAESAEYVATIDVSEIASEGSYTITVDEKEATFSVSENVYETLNEAAFKYYYFNRASTEITAQYGGEYARALGLPDQEVLVHPSAASDERPAGTVISAPKGWYDAGDYNKYIVNSGISTYTLLAAFEHYPSYFESKAYDIPETTNNLPDVLDEVKWNLDWMLAMQDPNDGGVYHKLTGLNFQGIIMPSEYTAERYVVQKSTAAALNFAAVTAVASRIYEEYEDQLPGFSAQLLAASRRAYDWAVQNPTAYYQQPEDVFTGEYGDNNVTDEFQWAAVELLITTGEENYADAVDVSAIGGGIPFWGYTAPLALVSIAAHADQLSDDLDVEAANAKLLDTSNGLKDKVNNSAMRVAMGTGDFNWGSNGQAGNQLMLLLMAYQISDDESFLDAAFTASDYLVGRNATGYSFVSGFGDQPMNNPHHRISEADTVENAVPGMIAGGPHSGQQDGCPGYPSNEPARSYVDTWCSYSTNEVTINWNAPLFYATAGLYLTLEQNPVEEEEEAEEEEVSVLDKLLKLYPNPFINDLNVDLGDMTEVNIKVFSLDGKLMISKNLETATPMDATSLPGGIYLLQVEADGRKFTAKIVKQ